MKVEDLVQFFNSRFPLYLQEEYDNSGEQVSFSGETVSGIMICLDLDKNVISEAISKKCNMIVAHHPFFFSMTASGVCIHFIIDRREFLYCPVK